MKSKRSITLSLLLSLIASQAVFAESKKAAPKPSTQPAKTKPAAEAPKEKAAPDAPAAEKAAPAPEIKDPVAVLDGDKINRSEVDALINNMMKQRGGGSVADIPASQLVAAYRAVLEDLIVNRLVTKKAADIKVTDEEVDSAFKQATAGHSEEEVKEQIAKSGQTLENIKGQIRTSLSQNKWIESQIKDKIQVPDSEAEDFYKKNPEQFKTPEQVRASHILVAVKPDATPEQVKEKEKAAQGIYDRVTKGEDFAKLAKELSEDPSAKQNSGDLDYFSREMMVPEFSSVAFTLKKDEISKPVRSQFGYHIIKATGHKDAETMELDKVKPQLISYLKQQKQRAEVQKLIGDLRAKADVKINLPEPPAPPVEPAPAPGK